MMTEWTNVSQAVINKPERENIRGIRVEMMISPSDLPKASRTIYDEEAGELVIEFRYLMSNEPVHDTSSQDGVRFTVGKNSGKIYKVHINPELVCKNGEEKIELTLAVQVAEESLNVFAKNRTRRGSDGNAKAIKNYFHEMASQNVNAIPVSCSF